MCKIFSPAAFIEDKDKIINLYEKTASATEFVVPATNFFSLDLAVILCQKLATLLIWTMLFREELLQALEEQLERKLSIELYSSDGTTVKYF
jgi:hypothetical protein